MSGPWGVTPTGFNRKPLVQILSDLKDGLKGVFGQDFNMDPSTPEGQFVGILSGEIDPVWAALQVVYNMMDPLQAGDASLDNICRITGTRRNMPSPSTSVLTVVGTRGTVVSSNSQVSAVGVIPKLVFFTINTVTLALATDYFTLMPVPGQAYPIVAGTVMGYRGNVYTSVNNGTTSSIPPPPGSTGDHIDGSVIWRTIGSGDSFASVPVQCFVNGPVTVGAYSLIVIETPTDGWNGSINLSNVLDGALPELDALLRPKRERELKSSGLGTAESVRLYLMNPLNVPLITTVSVFVNDTDAIGPTGMPPHSMEVMAFGGADSDVALSIWRSKPMGTTMIGNTSYTIIDGSGNQQTIKFTRPSSTPVYIRIDVSINSVVFPLNGDSLIAGAVVSSAMSQFTIGTSVAPSALYGSVVGPLGVPGVTSISVFTVARYGATPISSPLPMGPRELPTFSIANVIVNHV